MSASREDDAFLLMFPLWFLVNPSERQRPFVTLTAPAIVATPLFSDKDLAERFMDSAAGMRPNYRLGSIPDPAVLLQFLDGFLQKGFTHVAIDPSLQRSHFQPLADLRDRVRAALEQPGTDSA